MIIAIMLFLIPAVLALVGTTDVFQAAPPVPMQAIEGLEAVVSTGTGHAAR